MTDMRRRLGVIKERAAEIKRKYTPCNVPSDDDGDIAVLAYLVNYLAVILDKHLESREE